MEVIFLVLWNYVYQGILIFLAGDSTKLILAVMEYNTETLRLQQHS